MQTRCCPGDSYPEVLLLVDRGTGQSTTYLSGNLPYADYSYLQNEWTTAKELLALPGELLYALGCRAGMVQQQQQQQLHAAGAARLLAHGKRQGSTCTFIPLLT
jgi:hypothetical protein